MMRLKNLFNILVVLISTHFVGCVNFDNELSEQEKVDGWELLFDGKTLKGWRGYKKQDVHGPWKVESGQLIGLGMGSDSTSYLISESQFENFILSFDWKISKGGNSGIFYHVVERDIFKVPDVIGAEYQIIDEIEYLQELSDMNKVGANNDMYLPVKSDKSVKKPGRWNHSKIVFDNGNVEHWLNGEKLLEFEAWSEDWFLRKAGGKMTDYPEYGLARYGHFALQTHNGSVWYKNIKVKELPRKQKEEVPLFDGTDLNEWIVYGKELWYVENGELICESGPDKDYGYLGTRKYYNDFDLSLEFNQVQDGNSGIFFRSVIQDKVDIAKLGWQVEVAPPGYSTAGIYESGGGRGWIVQPPAEKDNLLKMGEWNTMRIRVVKDQVTTWLNGELMVDLKDEKIGRGQGRIMLQIHSIGQSGGHLKVKWRKIRIKEL